MIDDDPDFCDAVSLLADLERFAGEHGYADVLAHLGMARAELTDFGQRRPSAYARVDVVGLPSGLAELTDRLAALLTSSTSLQHALRIEAALRIMRRVDPSARDAPYVETMARLEPNAPVYAFPQPDGTSVTLDLSVRNGFCDFAMEMRFADGVHRETTAYHTGAPGLFIALLHCWVHLAAADEVIAGIAWVRSELETTTAGRHPSGESENDFDCDLQVRSDTRTGPSWG